MARTVQDLLAEVQWHTTTSQQLLSTVNRLLSGGQAQGPEPAPIPAPAPLPIPTPVPVPIPLPVPIEEPTATGAEMLFTVTDLLATVWGNASDERRGDWRAFAYAWATPPSAGSGKRDLYVALPARVARGTFVDLYVGDKSVLGVMVIDVGPWNIDDPYWEAGTRPQAETGTDRSGRSTNKAGIDLTPLLASRLSGQSVDNCYAREITLKLDRIVVHVPNAYTDELLSPHFSRREAERSATADSLGIANRIPANLMANARRCASEILEPIREVYGPFSPSSLYRSPELNAKIPGASKTSKHMQALATDVPRTQKMWEAIKLAMEQGDLSHVQVLIEPDHYHLAVADATSIDVYNTERQAWER